MNVTVASFEHAAVAHINIFLDHSEPVDGKDGSPPSVRSAMLLLNE